jgi:hypothetical protein
MDQVSQVWMQVAPFLSPVYEAFRAGFYSVNNGTGIIISFVIAYMMPAYARIGVAVLGAAFVLQAWWFLRGGLNKLPPLVEPGFWIGVLENVLGFWIIITVFYVAIQLFNRLFNESREHSHGH